MEMVQGLEDVSGIGGYGYNSQVVRNCLRDLRRAVRRLAELADSSGRGRTPRGNDAGETAMATEQQGREGRLWSQGRDMSHEGDKNRF